MGELILLAERLADRSRPLRRIRRLHSSSISAARSRTSRRSGSSGSSAMSSGFRQLPPTSVVRRGRSRPRCAGKPRRRAVELRLPLVWPDGFPVAAPSALRAAAYAAEIGAGARFALAASRLAFCGGFDLEDPEILAEAAARCRCAAARVPRRRRRSERETGNCTRPPGGSWPGACASCRRCGSGPALARRRAGSGSRRRAGALGRAATGARRLGASAHAPRGDAALGGLSSGRVALCASPLGGVYAFAAVC